MISRTEDNRVSLKVQCFFSQAEYVYIVDNDLMNLYWMFSVLSPVYVKTQIRSNLERCELCEALRKPVFYIHYHGFSSLSTQCVSCCLVQGDVPVYEDTDILFPYNITTPHNCESFQ